MTEQLRSETEERPWGPKPGQRLPDIPRKPIDVRQPKQPSGERRAINGKLIVKALGAIAAVALFGFGVNKYVGWQQDIHESKQNIGRMDEERLIADGLVKEAGKFDNLRISPSSFVVSAGVQVWTIPDKVETKKILGFAEASGTEAFTVEEGQQLIVTHPAEQELPGDTEWIAFRLKASDERNDVSKATNAAVKPTDVTPKVGQFAEKIYWIDREDLIDERTSDSNQQEMTAGITQDGLFVADGGKDEVAVGFLDSVNRARNYREAFNEGTLNTGVDN